MKHIILFAVAIIHFQLLAQPQFLKYKEFKDIKLEISDFIRETPTTLLFIGTATMKNNDKNIVILRTDNTYNLIDQKIIESPWNESGKSLCIVPDGIVLIGYGKNSMLSNGQVELALKLDVSLQSILWKKSYYYQNNSVRNGTLGKCLAFGDTIMLFGGSRVNNSYGNTDYTITSISAIDGEIITSHSFENHSNQSTDQFGDLILSPSGQVFLCGGNYVVVSGQTHPFHLCLMQWNRSTNQFDFASEYYGGNYGKAIALANTNANDMLVLVQQSFPNRYNFTGKSLIAQFTQTGTCTQNVSVANLTDTILLTDMRLDASNNIYAIGTIEDHLNSFGKKDMLVLKIAPDFSHIIKAKFLGTTENDIPKRIAIDGNGGVQFASTSFIGANTKSYFISMDQNLEINDCSLAFSCDFGSHDITLELQSEFPFTNPQVLKASNPMVSIDYQALAISTIDTVQAPTCLSLAYANGCGQDNTFLNLQYTGINNSNNPFSLTRVINQATFIDNITITDSGNISPLVFREGQYSSISLTDANGCTLSMDTSFLLKIKALPQTKLITDTVCIGNPIVLEANDMNGLQNAYNWVIDGNMQNATGNQFNATTYNAGPHSFTVTATSADLCKDTVASAFLIHSLPSSSFNLPSHCLTDSVAILPNIIHSTSSYTWTLDGKTVSNETSWKFFDTISNTHTVSLLVSDSNKCESSFIIQDKIKIKPQATFSVSNVCKYDSAKFLNHSLVSLQSHWAFGDGYGSTNYSPQHLFNPGTYNSSLVVSDGYCSDSAYKNLTSFQTPDATININGFCTNEQTVVYASNLSTPSVLSWAVDGMNKGNQNSFSFISTIQDTFTISLHMIDTNNCESTIKQDVTIAVKPNANFVSDTVCLKQATTFTNQSTNATNYVWSFGDGENSNLADPSHTYNTDGNFNVTLLAFNSNCTDTSFKKIVVNPLPMSQFETTFGTITELGQPVQFQNQSIGYSSIFWQLPENNTSTISNPTLTLKESGNYPVVLIASNQFGCSDTAQGKIQIINHLYVPNSFSPNGDGVNDNFQIFGLLSDINMFNIKIFNRWGEKVFESDNPKFTWNGSFKNQALNPSVLVYELNGATSESPINLKGSITLLR